MNLIDDFRGGQTLKDVMLADLPPHVTLSRDTWDGSQLMGRVDDSDQWAK